MSNLGRILLVEDDPKDVELTLTALEEYKFANEVVKELGIFWALVDEPPPGSVKKS